MKRILLLMALVLPMMAYGQNSVTVESPDKSISMTFASVRGELKYKVKYGKNEVVSYSSVALDTDKGIIGENVRFGKATRSAGVEEYDLHVGKTSHVKSPWQEAVIPLIDKNGCGLDVSVQVRVFDDAAAYRLIFKTSGEDRDIRIKNEVMDVNVTGNPIATALFFDHFINTHEGLYTRKNVTDLDENRLIDMPTHFEFADGTQMAVTEASIINYAGMYLTKKDGRLTSRLSPRLDAPQFSVLLEGEGKTPWRVFMLGDHVATLMESTVLTSLCEPCKIEDTSWLKPGKTTFPWWNDTVMPDDTPFQAGNNFLTNKHYIDFAADHGLEYHSVYGYADMPWYYDDGPGFGLAGPNADLTRHDPRLDFPAVCRYAKSRGVDIHVWLNWAALYKDIDRVFDKFNEWGIKGMMVDFMDRNDQQMILIQEDILRKAAEHQLFIQFHGSSKPSGLSRTWPNEFTREGALNYEVYKWDGARTMGADHDINMFFTRALAGPTDYHLGGFRSKSYDQWRVQYHAPLMTSTRCHMLGMYVILEGYLSMVCDYPEAYIGQPGFRFIQEMPTTWDQTKVVDAKVAEYAVTARRKGDTWYVGCINNSKERDLDISFGFLGEGKYKAEIYVDADDSDMNPDHLTTGTRIVDAGTVMPVNVKGSGGFAMKIYPVKDNRHEHKFYMAPPDTTAGIWVRPSSADKARPKWGFKNGIQVGIAPTGGPRGLLRIYTPYLEQPRDYVTNFIAIEPIPENGRDIRGLSELERSSIDGRNGKIFWSSDDDILDEDDKQNFARGVIETIDGEQTLTLYIFCERFDNGVSPYVRLRFKESNPYEFELATYTVKDGTPEPDYCILTATMGNKMRLRNLFCKDKVYNSRQLWPDYTGDGFVPHFVVPSSEMMASSDGQIYFIAEPDEADPASRELNEGTNKGWKYIGKKAVQYWRKPFPNVQTKGLVNGRYTYWASKSPIPEGIAYENFELKSPFVQGDRFVFGIAPVSSEEFINNIIK